MNFFAKEYDRRSGQKPVKRYSEIKSFLDKLPVKKWEDLPASWKKFADPGMKFHAAMTGKKFYVLKGYEVFRYFAGEYRLNELLPEDEYFRKNIEALPEGSEIYWLINPAILERFIALQDALSKKGYDPQALRITNGYRYPEYNRTEGGASHSRHIWGEAIDFDVRDINRDGTADQKDKSIVLELLDKQIIGSRGGVGRYPGTMGLHMDVRGRYARWDSY